MTKSDKAKAKLQKACRLSQEIEFLKESMIFHQQKKINYYDRLTGPSKKCDQSFAAFMNTIQKQIDRDTAVIHEVTRIIQSVEDDKCRQVLQLRYLEDKSIEEIAEQMHYSSMTVNRIHKRALQAVADQLQLKDD